MTTPEKPEPGVYQHFRGGRYRVLFVASDANTLELTVVYVALFGEGIFWVRSVEDWNAHVERDGYSGPRFRRMLV